LGISRRFIRPKKAQNAEGAVVAEGKQSKLLARRVRVDSFTDLLLRPDSACNRRRKGRVNCAAQRLLQRPREPVCDSAKLKNATAGVIRPESEEVEIRLRLKSRTSLN
jgi:hypothetical protein